MMAIQSTHRAATVVDEALTVNIKAILILIPSYQKGAKITLLSGAGVGARERTSEGHEFCCEMIDAGAYNLDN